MQSLMQEPIKTKRINIDREHCISCLMCVATCGIKNDGKGSKNRVVKNSAGVSTPIFCRQCNLPECAITCMTGAMQKNTATGAVEYNKEKCASCYMCIMACPYGVLKAETDKQTNEQSFILKCDLCADQDTAQCVAKCPMGAIQLEEVV